VTDSSIKTTGIAALNKVHGREKVYLSKSLRDGEELKLSSRGRAITHRDTF
jgi:hypothetical protein